MLSDRKKILGVVRDEIRAIGENYGDRRRTEIVEQELDDASPEDFIKKEDVVVSISRKGFAKRLSTTEYKAQGRGGKGTIGAKLVDGDFVDHLFVCSSHDIIMFVTSFGKAYYIKAFEIPEGAKTTKGASIKNFLQIENDEKVTSIITFSEFSDEDYLLMVTRYGVAKKVKLNDFINAKARGVKAIILDEGDSLISSIFVHEEDDAMIVTRNGKGLRIHAEDVRTMGRATHGVRGIRLIGDDEVIGVVPVDNEKRILMVTENGKGKQVRFDQFMAHGRGTMGQKIYTIEDGGLVGAVSVDDDTDVVFVTLKGQTIRVHAKDISIQGRAAMGVKVASFKKKDDSVNAVAVTKYQDMEEAEEEEPTPAVSEEPEA